MWWGLDSHALDIAGAEESAGVLVSVDSGTSWQVMYRHVMLRRCLCPTLRTGLLTGNRRHAQAHGSITNEHTTLIEGSLVEMRNKTVFMVFRTTTGCLFSSISFDRGGCYLLYRIAFQAAFQADPGYPGG